MDPFFLPAILNQAMPAVVVFIVFGSPLALIYMLRSFRLREKELDLRRVLAERPRDEEIKALEERVDRLERDRAFFERLAERGLRVKDTTLGAKARVSEPIEVEAILEPLPEMPEMAEVAHRVPRNGVYAP